MRKKVTLIVIGLVVLVAVAGFAVWWLMGQPLYKPGMVRSGKNLRSPLVPPEQTSEEPYWLVEGDVRLFYHTQGTGRPVVVIHGGPGFPIRQPLMALEPLAGHTSSTTTISEVVADRRSHLIGSHPGTSTPT